MASIFYTLRIVALSHPHSVSSSSSSGGGHRRAALFRSHRPNFCVCACPRSFSLRACASSDLGDPERLSAFEGEDYSSSVLLHASSGSFQPDSASSQTPSSSLGDEIEATSQLNESVPSLSHDHVEEEEVGGGGGSGSGDRGGGGGDGKGDGESEDKHKKGMSMSQKLTLAYAMLVGVGGAIGYAKSKSTKSLAAGGISSLVLFYVSSQLPSNPVFASSLGLGVSAVLLTVMGARYKKSGKVFPAGVVALVSLIMTGGYVHGIMRSHA